MGAIGTYILSITGIVVLGVIIDLMLVEGQMQKYIKSIYVIFVIFVIMSPIPKLFKQELYINTPTFYEELNIDEKLIKTINSQKKIELENVINEKFLQHGISGVLVEVLLDDTNLTFMPKKIMLNIKELVIENNYLNINKYEVLAELVGEVININKEIIVFYE